MKPKSEKWYYCPECGAQGFLLDMLTGDDCCIGVAMEET